MRIGLVSPPWVPVPPPAYGGLEAVVDRLARGLVDAGHEILLAAPANSLCPVPQVKEHGRCRYRRTDHGRHNLGDGARRPGVRRDERHGCDP